MRHLHRILSLVLLMAMLSVTTGCSLWRQMELGLGAMFSPTRSDYDALEKDRAAHAGEPVTPGDAGNGAAPYWVQYRGPLAPRLTSLPCE